MGKKLFVLLCSFSILWAASGRLRLQASSPRQFSPPSILPQRALLDKYCVTCDNQRAKTAGLSVDAMDLVRVAEAADTWVGVVGKVRGGEMLPGWVLCREYEQL